LEETIVDEVRLMQLIEGEYPYLPAGLELELKLLVFRPLRTSAFARSACPLILG
jgi:hypothetical protein